MKREINLLPPDFQAARHKKLYGQGVSGILRRLYVGLLLVAVMFGGAYVLLRMIIADVQVKQVETGTTAELEKRVQEANELIEAIDSRVTSYAPWTPQLRELLAVLPAELTLTTITVSDVTHDLTIKGISRTPEAAVSFEQAAAALPWVASVNAPLQNFATGPQTSFTLTLKRKEALP